MANDGDSESKVEQLLPAAKLGSVDRMHAALAGDSIANPNATAAPAPTREIAREDFFRRCMIQEES